MSKLINIAGLNGYFKNYAGRYQNNKDSEGTFINMLKALSEKEKVELLFQIGANIPVKDLEGYLSSVEH